MTISPNVRSLALASRSSYVENILRHQLIAALSSELWKLDPEASLEVLNSEVDSAGVDVVLTLDSSTRYVQLKQHSAKNAVPCSVRRSFSKLPGACVVLMKYSPEDLTIDYVRFFGRGPSEPTIDIDSFPVAKHTRGRDGDGKLRSRENYRMLAIKHFSSQLNVSELLRTLFPSIGALGQQN